MKELLLQFMSSKIFVYSMYIYLFMLIIYIVYSSLNYFKYHSRMQKTLQSIYNQMSESERARAEAERRQRDIHGAGIKHDMLSNLDEELAYSGIKEKFRWMTTELYIVIVLLTAALGTIMATAIGGFIIGLIVAFAIVCIFKLAISIMNSRRERKIEEQMLQFMNIIENFSRTSDDIIDILEKTARYIDDPLSSHIRDAVHEARGTGDSELALQDLQDNVKNKYFKVLIRNLDTTSKLENNYADIIEDCRNVFHSYIKSQKEKRSIRKNGVVEIIAMIIIGFLCTYMVGQMTPDGNILYTLLHSGVLGIAVLWILIISLIICLYIMIFKVIRSKND